QVSVLSNRRSDNTAVRRTMSPGAKRPRRLMTSRVQSDRPPAVNLTGGNLAVSAEPGGSHRVHPSWTSPDVAGLFSVAADAFPAGDAGGLAHPAVAFVERSGAVVDRRLN